MSNLSSHRGRASCYFTPQLGGAKTQESIQETKLRWQWIKADAAHGTALKRLLAIRELGAGALPNYSDSDVIASWRLELGALLFLCYACCSGQLALGEIVAGPPSRPSLVRSVVGRSCLYASMLLLGRRRAPG